MFSEFKVTEIYCIADDFCKEFALQQEKYMIVFHTHHQVSYGLLSTVMG